MKLVRISLFVFILMAILNSTACSYLCQLSRVGRPTKDLDVSNLVIYRLGHPSLAIPFPDSVLTIKNFDDYRKDRRYTSNTKNYSRSFFDYHYLIVFGVTLFRSSQIPEIESIDKNGVINVIYLRHNASINTGWRRWRFVVEVPRSFRPESFSHILREIDCDYGIECRNCNISLDFTSSPEIEKLRQQLEDMDIIDMEEIIRIHEEIRSLMREP